MRFRKRDLITQLDHIFRNPWLVVAKWNLPEFGMKSRRNCRLLLATLFLSFAILFLGPFSLDPELVLFRTFSPARSGLASVGLTCGPTVATVFPIGTWCLGLQWGFSPLLLYRQGLIPDSPLNLDLSDATVAPGSNGEPHPAIDAVITWVNGSDPLLAIQMRNFPPPEGILNRKRDVRDYDTLRYLILSIKQNAPWFRHIYVISGTHRPSWWQDVAGSIDNIQFLMHSEFIPEERLPTFNSEVIYASTDLIPGIADMFVLFDDDYLLPNPVRVDDFLADRTALFQTGCNGRDPATWDLAMVRNRVGRYCQLCVKGARIFEAFLIRTGCAIWGATKSECGKTSVREAGKHMTMGTVGMAYPAYNYLQNCHRPTIIEKDVFREIKRAYSSTFLDLYRHKYRSPTIQTQYFYTNMRIASGIVGKHASSGTFVDDMAITYGEITCNVNSITEFVADIKKKRAKLAILNDDMQNGCSQKTFLTVTREHRHQVDQLLTHVSATAKEVGYLRGFVHDNPTRNTSKRSGHLRNPVSPWQ